jgi:peroxiredoxin
MITANRRAKATIGPMTSEEVKSEQIEDILAKLSEMGVNVLETEEADPEDGGVCMRAVVFGRMILNATHTMGWKARDFALTGTDDKTYSLAEVWGPKGTLVVFICNHCPYVKASINRIVAEANALRGIGIGSIARMPNDTDAYPEDSFDNMKAFAVQHGFKFAYVIDTTQEVARAYDAQCTPDFSASTRKTSCNIEVGSMPHVCRRSRTLVATYLKQ